MNPDVSRGELVALIESSALEITEDQHKDSHIAAERRAGVDYVDWYRVNNQSRLSFVDGVRTVVDRELAL